MTTTHLGSIVVAVDGSTHAERAVLWAVEQASLERRTLDVVAVPAPGDHRRHGRLGRRVATGHEARIVAYRIARDAVRRAEQHRPGVRAEAHTVAGDARDVLVDLSREAHLLVLGSRGRGSVRSMLLGSVSTAVVKAAACPVVVCRPTEGRPPKHGVLVAADGTAESLPVIEFAFQQAATRGLPLTVVHCFWDVVAAAAGFRRAADDLADLPHVEELKLVLAESVAGFQEKFPDVNVATRLRHGLIDEALTDHTRAWDLVVVGRHPVTSLHRTVVGSIATAVIERSHSNVAVVPEAATADADAEAS